MEQRQVRHLSAELVVLGKDGRQSVRAEPAVPALVAARHGASLLLSFAVRP